MLLRKALREQQLQQGGGRSEQLPGSKLRKQAGACFHVIHLFVLPFCKGSARGR